MARLRTADGPSLLMLPAVDPVSPSSGRIEAGRPSAGCGLRRCSPDQIGCGQRDGQRPAAYDPQPRTTPRARPPTGWTLLARYVRRRVRELDRGYSRRTSLGARGGDHTSLPGRRTDRHARVFAWKVRLRGGREADRDLPHFAMRRCRPRWSPSPSSSSMRSRSRCVSTLLGPAAVSSSRWGAEAPDRVAPDRVAPSP